MCVCVFFLFFLFTTAAAVPVPGTMADTTMSTSIPMTMAATIAMHTAAKKRECHGGWGEMVRMRKMVHVAMALNSERDNEDDNADSDERTWRRKLWCELLV